MGTGSAVFHQEGEWVEFFQPNLEPYIHYVPVNPNLSNLIRQVKWAKKNDAAVQRIARRGQDLVEKLLLHHGVSCYWGRLLSEYAKLLEVPPTLHDAAWHKGRWFEIVPLPPV